MLEEVLRLLRGAASRETSTFGYRSMNRGSSRARTSATADPGTESRTRPVTSPGRTDTVFRDSSA